MTFIPLLQGSRESARVRGLGFDIFEHVDEL